MLADAEEFVLDCTALFGAWSPDGGTTWQAALGTGDAKLTLDWADGYYALHAEVDGLAGIFDVEGDFVFESGKEIAILAEATVVIPHGDPVHRRGHPRRGRVLLPARLRPRRHRPLDHRRRLAHPGHLRHVHRRVRAGLRRLRGSPAFSLIGGDQVAQFEQDVAPPVDQNYTYNSTFTRGTNAGQIAPGATSAVFGVDWSKSAVGVGLNGPPTFQVVKIVDGDAGAPIAEADFAANGISFVTDSRFNTPTSRAIQVVGSATDEYAPLGADYKL